jgi:hypothetical protein
MNNTANGTATVQQRRELAATIAAKAQALADGTLTGPEHAAAKLILSNAQMLLDWTPDNQSAPGVNVTAILMTSGNFRVHKAGCGDIAKDMAGTSTAPGRGQGRQRLTAATQLGVITELWEDILEQNGDDPETYRATVEFVSCCERLLPRG